MCGILGIINNEKDTRRTHPETVRFLREGLHSGIFRGRDSTGILHIDRDFDADVFKSTLSGDEVAKQKKPSEILDMASVSKAMIIHHRAATKGNVSYDNAHPFEHDLDDKRWLIGVHNGGVDFRRVEDNIKFDVDSDHLYYRMTRDGAAKALGETHGAFALVWADMITKRIHIASNEERAIHFAPVVGSNTILFASEAAMLYAWAIRNGLNVEQIYRPKTGLIYSFDPSGDLRKWTALPFEKPVRKEVVSNVAPRKTGSTYNPKTRAHETENANFKFEDSYGPSATDGLKLSSGEDALFVYRTAVTNIQNDNKFDVYGEVMDTNAEVMKAVILSMPKTLVDNVRDADDIYAKIIGRRDIIDKKTGNLTKVLLMAPPHIIQQSDKVDKLIAELGDALNDPLEYTAEDTAGDRTVRGPEGKQISIKKYLGFVNNGCSRCGDSITTQQADEIGWVHGEQPVCHECCGPMAMAGYEVN